MITQKTVFIIGAGASIPYKFPSGSELVNIICENLNPATKSYQIVQETSDCHSKDVDEFRNSLKHSGKMSVDGFLEHRPEFLKIGKMAIATALIQFECPGNMFGSPVGNRNWYEYLYNRMNSSFENFNTDKFSILTFNYDRSFEYFLFTSLKHSYGKNDEDIYEKLRKLNIIHLHGQLGYLPWQSDNYREYNNILNHKEVKKAGNAIKIISENFENAPQFKEAYQILSTSKYICFLGFGYNPANLERLKLDALLPNAKIMGSTFKLTSAEIKKIEENFGRKVELDPHGKHDCINFLRNHITINEIFSA